jgi:hypothetical protein
MGLNDIRLPGSVIAQLYRNTLVDTGISQTPAPILTARPPEKPVLPTSGQNPAWKFLGENNSRILVIVHYPGLPHLPDEELAFLTKMLSACKLSLGDVAILNLSHYPNTGSKELQPFFRSKIVFLFGVSPDAFGLPVNFPAFQVQNVAGTTYLYCPAMEERHTDELLKSKLWVCLRKIFGI